MSKSVIAGKTPASKTNYLTISRVSGAPGALNTSESHGRGGVAERGGEGRQIVGAGVQVR